MLIVAMSNLRQTMAFFTCNSANSSQSKSRLYFTTWHARLDHASDKIVSVVLNNCNISYEMNKIFIVCKTCCLPLAFYYCRFKESKI